MKKQYLSLILVLFFSLQHSFAGSRHLAYDDRGCGKLTFAESLADFVSGKIIEHDPGSGIKVYSSVIRIPTYYGYHSFLGVLDNYIAKYTSLTSLRTWRLADRNFYVIHLSQEKVSVTIIYDMQNSLLLLTTPAGY
jgi:hypothetical protein